MVSWIPIPGILTVSVVYHSCNVCLALVGPSVTVLVEAMTDLAWSYGHHTGHCWAGSLQFVTTFLWVTINDCFLVIIILHVGKHVINIVGLKSLISVIARKRGFVWRQLAETKKELNRCRIAQIYMVSSASSHFILYF